MQQVSVARIRSWPRLLLWAYWVRDKQNFTSWRGSKIRTKKHEVRRTILQGSGGNSWSGVNQVSRWGGTCFHWIKNTASLRFQEWMKALDCASRIWDNCPAGWQFEGDRRELFLHWTKLCAILPHFDPFFVASLRCFFIPVPGVLFVLQHLRSAPNEQTKCVKNKLKTEPSSSILWKNCFPVTGSSQTFGAACVCAIDSFWLESSPFKAFFLDVAAIQAVLVLL